MRLLLDTHIFLWFLKNDRQLSKANVSKIVNASEVYVSSASIWEAAVKIQLKKLDCDIDELIKAIDESGFNELPISMQHAATVFKLPLLHRDPFDRMLIAQAICEPLILLTADYQLQSYSKLVEVIK